MFPLVEFLKECATRTHMLCAVLLTPRFNFVPATMNNREGFDLRVCPLVDGSALLHVPHGSRSGMFCCEVEMALDMYRPEGRFCNRRAVEYLTWVRAGFWTDHKHITVTGRKSIYVECYGRTPSSWITRLIKWRTRKDHDMDVEMRHYSNFSFMSLLNHIWDSIRRTPKGFVERWALKGPEALDEAWKEACAINPKLNDKDSTMLALFNVLKEHAVNPG